MLGNYAGWRDIPKHTKIRTIERNKQVGGGGKIWLFHASFPHEKMSEEGMQISSNENVSLSRFSWLAMSILMRFRCIYNDKTYFWKSKWPHMNIVFMEVSHYK